MNVWLTCLFRARRRCRQAPPLGPPQRPAGFDFDALAKEVAAGVSRREALQRLGVGLGGALLATLGLGTAPVRAAGSSDCALFCTGIYPPGLQRGACVNAAAQGQGLCWVCGPAAPAGHPDVCGTASGSPFCCPASLPNCCGGSTCVNEQTDVNNCGACGNVCPQRPNASRACYQGACGYVCSTGYGDCNASAADGCETNLLTDVGHCGACDNPCPVRANATTTCTAGVCGFTCDSGFADCNGNAADGCETNLLNDPSHCGACGHACPFGETCVNGKCTCGNLGSDCPGGELCCNGMCEDPFRDVNNCGGCGHACAAGQGCCTGVCTDLQSNNLNCGACGQVCLPVVTGGLQPVMTQTACSNGKCCLVGTTNCGGTCTHLSSDAANCGACGQACGAGETCSGGTCQCGSGPACGAGQVCSSGLCCPTGQTNCGGTCTNLSGDAGNCGACNHTCGANELCVNGSCRCGAGPGCTGGQGCCGGTCVDLSSDPSNCGICGKSCISGACASGQCCPVGETSCGGTCVLLTVDPNNCGTCGHACNPGEACVLGQCLCGTSPPCTGGQVCCDKTCTTLGSNTNCSACGDNCVTALGAGGACCNGKCVDTRSDKNNCSACGTVCPGQVFCSNGHCVCPPLDTNFPTTPYCNGTCCLPGQLCCSGSCVSSDANNCGTCGNVCASNQQCCGGQCVFTAIDNNNCGECGFVCQSPAYCLLGFCQCPGGQTSCEGGVVEGLPNGAVCCDTGHACCFGRCCRTDQVCDFVTGSNKCVCPVGKSDCSAGCIDTTSDPNNCGGCGNVCQGGRTCIAGTCVCPTLAPTDCGGTCVATISDNNNCGRCGNVCTGDHNCVLGVCVCPPFRVECSGVCCPVGQICTNGTCTSCVLGQAFCNGHCIDVTTDSSNCGSCGHVCTGGKTCIAGSCVCPATAPKDCGGVCTDTVNDNNNCGSCGHVCTGGHTCVLGLCDCPTGRVECFGICCQNGQVCNFFSGVCA